MLREITSPKIFEPNVIQVAVAFEVTDEPLYWAERLGLQLPAALERAVDKRKSEFIAGRYCAGEALKRLLLSPQPTLAIGRNREPQWPDGVIGSITHTKGFASAAVIPASAGLAIGIDCEAFITTETTNRIYRQILTSTEMSREREQTNFSKEFYLSLLFSAKEALYKAIYPLTKQFIGFHDVEVKELDTESCAFTYRLLKNLNTDFMIGYEVEGRYQVAANHIHTGVMIS